MSMHIRLPNITGRTPEEQAQQMKSYLTQLAGELNWALGNLQSAESSVYEQYRSSNQGGSAGNPQQKAEDILKNFNDIKGLIIKSADIVNAYYEEINTRLEGLYVAQSEYGTFVEQTTSVLNQTSTGISQNYTNIQLVTGRVDQAEADIVSTRNDLTQTIAQAEQSLQEAIGQVEENLGKTIADTDAALTKTINDTDASLRQAITQTEQSLQEAIDNQDTELRKVISQVDADLQQVVTETENRLAGTVSDTEESLQQVIAKAKDDMKNDIEAAEQNMSNNISAVETNLSNSIANTRTDLEGSISNTETTLTNSIIDTTDVLGKNIANTNDVLGQEIANAKADLQGGIDKAKEDLSDSIKDATDSLDNKISDTKGDLEKSISDAEDRLKELLESSNAVLVEVFAHINSGLLYTDENGIPVYGLEVGQRNLVNGQEVFNKYARFTASKLSFYDQNGTEVAYISDKKLYITHVEITVSLTHGGFVDTAMADKSIVTKWVGGG